LSVIMLFDHPLDFAALDEALFSLAVQDWERIEVIIALPDCGPDMHRGAEETARAQSWPEAAGVKVVSVATPLGRALSADLLNAGLAHASGRYVAFLHHQDLIYHHAYPSLIDLLRRSEAAVAFGGMRCACYARAARHWQVLTKTAVPSPVSRLGYITNGLAAIHCQVADRLRLPGDQLRVHNPTSEFAVAMFLLRLALHPGADFALAADPVGETRQFTESSPLGASGSNRRLPLANRLVSALESGDLVVRGPVPALGILLAEAMKALTQPIP